MLIVLLHRLIVVIVLLQRSIVVIVLLQWFIVVIVFRTAGQKNQSPDQVQEDNNGLLINLARLDRQGLWYGKQ